MPRWLAVVSSLFILPFVFAQEPAAPVKIAWYGQSFFTITSSKGTVLAIDPHQIPEFGRAMGLKPDGVLISHQHSDHVQIGIFENAKDLKVFPGLKGGGKNTQWNPIDEEFKGFKIRNVGSYHDGQEGLKFGKNSIFIVEVDGWKIAHLGDLGHTLSEEQIRKVGPIDVLMVPVGGVYALNGSEAREVVSQLKPKEYIFPMHMGTKAYDQLLPADEFLEETEKARIATSDDNTVTLNRDPQRPKPLVVLLHHAPKGK